MQLCNKKFANGRALGGHMRSHMMNQITTSDEDSQESDEFQSIHSFSSSEEDQENRKKGSFFLDQELKSRVFFSNEFDMIMNEEDVAYCLMMLSRDHKWRREKKINARVRERKYYRCESCDKCFRSYQALGGHRSSHKKVKVNEAAVVVKVNEVVAPVVAAAVEKIYECPFCNRVFASGQALGGHKRTHFSGSSAISASVGTVEQFLRKGETLDIDLNLPAVSSGDGY